MSKAWAHCRAQERARSSALRDQLARLFFGQRLIPVMEQAIDYFDVVEHLRCTVGEVENDLRFDRGLIWIDGEDEKLVHGRRWLSGCATGGVCRCKLKSASSDRSGGADRQAIRA